MSLGTVDEETDAGERQEAATDAGVTDVYDSSDAFTTDEDRSEIPDVAPVSPTKCARALTGDAGVILRQVAVDSAYNSLLVGSFSGTLDTGSGVLSSAGDWDAFLAKFGPNCEPLWSKRFGDAQPQFGSAVACDSANDIFIAIGGSGAIDFGSGTLPSVPAADTFLAKFDKDGNLAFAKHFGDIVHTFHIDSTLWLTADPVSNSIIMAGYFGDDIDFGGGTLHGRTNGTSMFVTKFSVDGTNIWSKAFGTQDDGGTAAARAYGAVFTANGDVAVTGVSYGAFDFGGAPLPGSLVVGELAGDTGAHKWSRSFDNAIGYAITTTSTGSVVVAGDVNGTTDFGKGSMTSQGDDAFILSLAADGSPEWAKVLGDSATQFANAVVAFPSGDVLVAGQMEGSTDFGAGPLTSAGANDIFLARYTRQGVLVDAGLLGDSADQSYPFLTLTGSNLVVIGGRFQGTLDTGINAPLVNPGSTNDVFLLQR